MNRAHVVVVILSFFGGLTAGCSGTGKAKVQLDNIGAAGAALTEVGARSDGLGEIEPIPAELFQMKILSAYLVEDVDPESMNNVGYVERIWVNPDCPSADGCRDTDVGYFDLTDPTEANQKLNSQNPEISTGTYRYVRVEFCNGGAQGNLVRYKTAGMAEPVEATYGGCGVTSALLDPPLELGDGETVTIALEYDLSEGPLYFVEGNPTCGSVDTPTPCLGGITLTPRIVR